MPLHLLLSTSTERLIDDLVASLAEPGPAGALRPVLLPSRPLVERVKAAMARRCGVAMGVEFLLPAAFVERLAKAVGHPPQDTAWSPEGLFWRLLPLVEGMASEPRLKEACSDPRAKLALARQVADRFDQYLHFRPQLIDAWDQGKPWKELPPEAKVDEAWQLKLWQGLKAGIGDAPHPAQRLVDLRERARNAEAGLLGKRVEVLTTGPLPTSLLQVLAAFGQRNQVHLRCLLPSVEYLGDIETKTTLRLRGKEPDPHYLVHDLLAQQGRQAVETFRALMDLEESGQSITTDYVADEPGAAGATLLNALQADIRAARPPDPSTNTLSETPQSLHSLRVHRCHGARREVEVLRDELLEAFSRDASLRPEDVLILAPDLEAYGPLAQALLPRSLPPLPLKLAERRQEQLDPAYQAVAGLLRFAAGRATLSEGLGLLELPAVQARLGDETTLALQQRLEGSGITFGLNAGHRQSMGAGAESAGTWAAGLDRLLAGLWMGAADDAVDAQAVPVLPVAGALSSGRQGLGQGLDWLDTLLTLMLAWQCPCSPGQWALRLDAARQGLLGLGPDDDATALADLIGQLQDGEARHQCTQALEAASLLDWLDWLGMDESRSVPKVGGYIGLGGFKPLRALPCKVLAVLGLHDAAFPRRSQNMAWDLMAAKPMAGDRDPRKEDRQLFLDALLAASGQVILTAPARSLRTDKKEPFSSCVDELLRAALDTVPGEQRDAWTKALVHDHSLQPFSPGNYQGDAPSFDGQGLALATALQGPRTARAFMAGEALPQPAWGPALPDFAALLRLLKDPAAAYLRSLDLQLPGEAEDPAAQDTEPADLGDGLLNWQVSNAGLQAVLQRPEAFLLQRLQADRSLPYGILGQQAAAAPLGEARMAGAALLALSGGMSQARLFEAALSMGPLAGTLWVAPANDRLVLSSPSKASKAALQLEAYARAALAAAAGKPMGMLLLARSEKKQLFLQLLPALTVEQGRAWLESALGLWQAAQTKAVCFAPETSLALAQAWLKHQDRGAGFAMRLALEAADKEWDGDDRYGFPEGHEPAAKLAWRGRDAFEDGLAWKDLALELWAPVLTWLERAEAQDLGPLAEPTPKKKAPSKKQGAA